MHRCGARSEIDPVQHGLLDQIGVTVQIHPLLFGHAESARGFDRHQHRGRTLVDGVARDEQPRVGIADHPVLVGDRLHLFHGAFHRG